MKKVWQQTFANVTLLNVNFNLTLLSVIINKGKTFIEMYKRKKRDYKQRCPV